MVVKKKKISYWCIFENVVYATNLLYLGLDYKEHDKILFSPFFYFS